MQVPAGSVNVTMYARAMTAAGGALTGLVAADFDLWYRRDGAQTTVVLSDLTALTDAHTDGGVYEIDDGWYRFDLPDAACAAGVRSAATGGTVTGGVLLTAPVILTTTSDTGAGARTVDVTVDYLVGTTSTAIEGARVRMTKGTESYVIVTDVSGEGTFYLDDGTWTVTITKQGFSFTSTTLVVNGTEDETYTMTADSYSLSDPGFITGYLYCYDDEGVVEEDVYVYMVIYDEDDEEARGYDTAIRSEKTDATGLVQFTNLFPGATYMLRRGETKIWTQLETSYYRLNTNTLQKWRSVTIPADASSPYALPNLFGTDA